MHLTVDDIEATDNRGSDVTIVWLKDAIADSIRDTDDTQLEVDIEFCIYIITNMLENNPEARDDFRHWDEDMKRRNQ